MSQERYRTRWWTRWKADSWSSAKWVFAQVIGLQTLVAAAAGGVVVLAYSIFGQGKLGEPIYWWIAPMGVIGLISIGFAVIASLWNLVSVPGRIADDDRDQITRLTIEVSKLQVFDSVQNRVEKLRAETFTVRDGRPPTDREESGVNMFLQCASDLSAAGLCPQTLSWSWYGNIDWRVLLRFLGRLKVLGFVESKPESTEADRRDDREAVAAA